MFLVEYHSALVLFFRFLTVIRSVVVFGAIEFVARIERTIDVSVAAQLFFDTRTVFATESSAGATFVFGGR